LEFVELLGRPILWLLARPVVALLYLELYLLYRDSQRAEFLADALAATTAGARAVVALHEKMLLAGLAETVVQQAAHGQVADLFVALREQVTAIPDRERERRRRVARLEDTRLDATHPPVAHRIRLAETRGAETAAVVVAPDESRAVDDELRPHMARAARQLIEQYRSSLYDV
jgi:Zn-dependent protease with chaperone function